MDSSGLFGSVIKTEISQRFRKPLSQRNFPLSQPYYQNAFYIEQFPESVEFIFMEIMTFLNRGLN